MPLFRYLRCMFRGAAPAVNRRPRAAADNHIRVNLGTEPPSLDWSIATDHVSFNVIANLMVGLTEFDKDLKPAPVIAKSWELSDGGKKIVFKLRDDVQWSDGKKVRAQDFEYSWKRLLDPKTASQYAYILFDIVNAAEYAQGKLKDPAQVGVKAADDQTLVVTSETSGRLLSRHHHLRSHLSAAPGYHRKV